MRIVFDFADSSQAKQVPRHGWAKNSQGVKLLWVPVLRLVHQTHEILKAKGMSTEFSRKQGLEIRAFDQMVRHFALNLRELAKCIRLGSEPYFGHGSDEQISESHTASSLLPLHVDLAFVYARRLADHFVRATRFVLFKKHGSVPHEYKNLRSVIHDQKKLQQLQPLCDVELLREAFERHSDWLDKLRKSKDENGESQKGIRDLMEHHPVVVKVHHTKAGGPWEIIANLGESNTSPFFRLDLIRTLKEVVTDMADLWTMVCASVGLTVVSLPEGLIQWVAPYGDALSLGSRGTDDDLTFFWPESLAKSE